MAFRKAKSQQAALKLGIYGSAGSGKTFTSLLIAEGLANTINKRIAFVDTERGTDFYCQTVPERACHPKAFDFDAVYTRSVTECLTEIKGLDQNQYGVVVLDSISHIWDACIAAYAGNKTRAGTIPFHAWGKIKKPYRELVAFLLSSPLHVIFCGRQGNVYAPDDQEGGELKMVGYKMRAEGETAYEPHVLIRMEAVRHKPNEQAIVTALIEKDRTGILAGKVIAEPNFEKVCGQLLKLLGGQQAHIPNEDETAASDAEAIAMSDRKREVGSTDKLREFSAKIELCKTEDELKIVGKLITPATKKEMLTDHVAKLRDRYQAREQQIKNGGFVPEPEALIGPDGREITDQDIAF